MTECSLSMSLTIYHHILIYDITVTSVIFSARHLLADLICIVCVLNYIFIYLYHIHLQLIWIDVFSLIPFLKIVFLFPCSLAKTKR